MAARREAREPQRPIPRLYLVASLDAAIDALASSLEQALTGADIAAVLLRASTRDEGILVDQVKPLAAVVQQAGAAAVLFGHPEMVVRAGADGAHLIGYDALKSALPLLKPDRIVGAGGLHTRHDAMLAGEAGADYLMFGEPDATGHRLPIEAVIERVSWWSEIFEPPCVGYAMSMEESEALAKAGAEFIALDASVWSNRQGAREIVAKIAQRLSSLEFA